MPRKAPAEAPEAAPAPQVIFTHVAPQPTGARSPLFPSLGKGPGTPNLIKVWREDPADGYLGTIQPDADEEHIRQRWGGRCYRLEAINASGQAIPGGRRNILIQEAPRMLGEQQRPAAPDNGANMAVQILQQQMALEQQRAADAEAKATRELTAYVTKLKAEGEERLKQEEARHTRMMELERERAKASADESKNFLATMMQMNTASGAQTMQMVTAMMAGNKAADPSTYLSVMREGIQIAAGLGQPDPQVQMMETFSNGLGTIAQLAAGDRPAGQQGPSIVRQRGAGLQKRQVQPQQPQQQQQAPAPSAGATAKVRAIQEKAAQLFKGLIAEGQDPEKILQALIDGELVLAPADEFDDEEEPEENQENQPQGAAPAAPAQAPAGDAAVRGGSPNGGSAEGAPVGADRAQHG